MFEMDIACLKKENPGKMYELKNWVLQYFNQRRKKQSPHTSPPPWDTQLITIPNIITVKGVAAQISL